MSEKRKFTQEEQQRMYLLISDTQFIVLAKVANENARALLATFDPLPDHLPKAGAAGEGESC